MERATEKEAIKAVKTLISFLGEDPQRNALVDTPKRVIKSMRDHFAGYGQDPMLLLKSKIEEAGDYNGTIALRDIIFCSHCQHHMQIFRGKVHIIYKPGFYVAGLSKFVRAVEALSKRLQTQEKLTKEICHVIHTALQTKGTAVMIEAEHQCMSLRGVKSVGAMTVTTSYEGEEFSSINIKDLFG